MTATRGRGFWRTVVIGTALVIAVPAIGFLGFLAYRGLTGQHTTTSAAGKVVFDSAGCAACHAFAPAGSTGTRGPSLDNLKAEAARASQPLEVFLVESIVDPNTYIERGYQPNVMPATPNLSHKQIADVAAFLSPKTALPPEAVLGPMVFDYHLCGRCHTFTPAGFTGEVGPSLDNLKAEAARAGRPLEAFIRHSVVHPNAYIEPGFQRNIMPANFAQTIPSDQLDELVRYLFLNAR